MCEKELGWDYSQGWVRLVLYKSIQLYLLKWENADNRKPTHEITGDTAKRVDKFVRNDRLCIKVFDLLDMCIEIVIMIIIYCGSNSGY